jgi:hypothetical protein
MKAITTYCLTFALVASLPFASPASEGNTHKGIYYGPEDATEYQQEKCKDDFAQFILEKSGMAEPSEIFGAVESQGK